MSARKPFPERSCVVCHERRPKRELVRIVQTPEGVQVDPSGKMHGRGAYLCERVSCWERAIQGSALSKALRTELTDEDRTRLLQAKPSAGKTMMDYTAIHQVKITNAMD